MEIFKPKNLGRDGVHVPDGDSEYWHSLIDEKPAAAFLGLEPRTTQAMRQRGDGPKYISISARCIRYRRIDLKAWADSRLRTSTSDPGPEAKKAEAESATEGIAVIMKEHIPKEQLEEIRRLLQRPQVYFYLLIDKLA